LSGKGLFSGKEGDPVPARKESMQRRGQGPLPDLKIYLAFTARFCFEAS